jgi:xanthine dehydrogenase iron-sulfur cluster and FAD-binding subunit A
MWQTYITPHTLDEAMAILAEHQDHGRIVAGATDLILEIERGLRPGISTLIDITRLPGLSEIWIGEDGLIHLGPLTTHNHCAASGLIQQRAFALARACWEVGAPQIRNRGTVAGNVITASPANDSITPLIALDARVSLRSARGERVLALKDFYTGVRRTVMRPDEILTDIAFPPLSPQGKSAFIKLALRRAQAISIVNAAVALEMDGETVQRAAVALGAVAPTIVRAAEAEVYLTGKPLTPQVIGQAASLAEQAGRPIDDLRGSAAYRQEMIGVSVRRALTQIASGGERQGYPESPVMLWGPPAGSVTSTPGQAIVHDGMQPIVTTINGRRTVFERGHEKSLLRLIREDGHLTGTKEGCAEGECGACTVFLDGMAVMACMVPAPRAHGAEVITVEGLADHGRLHPIQQAFIEQGAVQCGYCTPGLLMSGAKLLEERARPDVWEIQQSITGNLCRCTGYYSIISAFERAAELAQSGHA